MPYSSKFLFVTSIIVMLLAVLCYFMIYNDVLVQDCCLQDLQCVSNVDSAVLH